MVFVLSLERLDPIRGRLVMPYLLKQSRFQMLKEERALCWPGVSLWAMIFPLVRRERLIPSSFTGLSMKVLRERSFPISLRRLTWY